MRVLIIEDDPMMGVAIQTGLVLIHSKFPDAVITIVVSLKDGLKILSSIPCPDITILDLSLPDSTWQETLSCVEEIDSRSPVIIVTGLSETAVRKYLLSPQVEVIYKNPRMFDKLLGAIVRAYQRSHDDNLDRIRDNLKLLRELCPHATLV